VGRLINKIYKVSFVIVYMDKKNLVKVYGIMAIIYGVLAIFLYISMMLSFSIFMANLPPEVKPPTDNEVSTKIDITSLNFLVFISSILMVIGGIGLLKHKNWARILLIIVSIPSLINVPLGTIFGVIFLVNLPRKKIKEVMK